jgi:hypothetical protein
VQEPTDVKAYARQYFADMLPAATAASAVDADNSVESV